VTFIVVYGLVVVAYVVFMVHATPVLHPSPFR